MATPELRLSTIYPEPKRNLTEPTYWGEPIAIPGCGTLGLEVTEIEKDKDFKRFRGLEFVLRNGTSHISLGMPRTPFYVAGKQKEITYQNGIIPNVPRTLKEQPGEAIITGFSSRTLEESLYGIFKANIDIQTKETLTLYLFLKTAQAVQDIHATEHIHGDLHPANIIVEDSLSGVNLIDMLHPERVRADDRKPSLSADVQSVLGDFRYVFGHIEDVTHQESQIWEKEKQTPWQLLTPEQCTAVLAECIDIARERLRILGYPVDTEEQRENLVTNFAGVYKQIQILQCFKNQEKTSSTPKKSLYEDEFSISEESP